MKGTIEAVRAEAEYAQSKYGDFASMHEGYGVLVEEVQELLEAIRISYEKLERDGLPHSKRGEAIRSEAIQVAAVALRMADQAGRVTR